MIYLLNMQINGQKIGTIINNKHHNRNIRKFYKPKKNM